MSYAYLDDHDTLLVNKQLACAIGLNNSIILRQIHYWLCLNQKAKSEKHFRDNCWWTFNTYDEWTLENFPFWSKDTVRRALVELTDDYGIIEVGNYNDRPGDQTKWYTINYARYNAYIEMWKDNGAPNVSERVTYKAFLPIWQVAKLLIASCIGQDSKLLSPLPETNTETSTEKKIRAPRVRPPKAKSLTEKQKWQLRLEPVNDLCAAIMSRFEQGYDPTFHKPQEYMTLTLMEKYIPVAEELEFLKMNPAQFQAMYREIKAEYDAKEWTVGLVTIREKAPAFMLRENAKQKKVATQPIPIFSQPKPELTQTEREELERARREVRPAWEAVS